MTTEEVKVAQEIVVQAFRIALEKVGYQDTQGIEKDVRDMLKI